MDDLSVHHPEILFVAFGAPKQEIWLSKNKQALTNCGIKIGMGIGGSFDYISGLSKRAPTSWQTIGMEWLWRVIQQPQRLPRIFRAVFTFPYYVNLWKKRLSLPMRKGVTCAIRNKDDKILCIHWTRQNGSWGLPGGGVEENESIEHAAVRETKEEVGLKNLTFEKAIGSYKYLWPLTWSRKGYRGQEKTICLLSYDGDDVDVILENNDEVTFDEYKWVEPKDLETEIHPVYRNVAKQIIAVMR